MRKSVFALFAFCVLAVLAVLAIGCGGGGGSTAESTRPASGDIQKNLPRPTHTLDKPELVQFSRGVCANITREIEGDFERVAAERGLGSGKQPTKAEIRELGEEIMLPLMHKQDREMINAGKDASAQGLQKIFEIGEEEVRVGWNHPAVAATDPGRVWARANPMLKRAGFTTCVRDKPLVE